MAKSRTGKVTRHRKSTGRPPVRSAATAGATLDRLLMAVRSDPADVGAALALAQYYYVNNLEDKVLSVLQPLERQYPFSDAARRRKYDHLIAFGYVREHGFAEAEPVIARALEDCPEALDLYYALAYLKVSLREFGDALEACRKYLSAFDESAAAPAGTHFTATSAHRSQLLNFMATAYRETAETGLAIETWQQAISADPTNHFPYLNLANLYMQEKDCGSAESTVRAGLRDCRQVQELRMLASRLENSATISACMIVKNEEEMLENCLRSIRDWVDEIVIVDTGSTDRTVEIAKSFGATVYHQAWEDNFSRHRNYSMDKATCDWIFIIDADEKVRQESVPRLRELVNSGKYPAYCINVFNVYGSQRDMVTFLPSVRLFRRDLNLRYEGIVHNLLNVPDDVPVARVDVRLDHYGYDLSEEKMKRKGERTRGLLEKQLEENPDDAFALFNYAQVLLTGFNRSIRDNGPVILDAAGRAVELTNPEAPKERHIHLMGLNQLAWTHFYLNDHEQALACARRALEIKPAYLDPLLLVGHAYSRLGRYDEAAEAYQVYLQAQESFHASTEHDNIILSHVDSRPAACYGLGMIAEIKGDTELARKWYSETLRAKPDYLEANRRLGLLYQREGNLPEAERYLRQQAERAGNTKDLALDLAAVYSGLKDNDRAEECFRQAMELAPEDPNAPEQFGQFCLTLERYDRAGELFQKAIAMAGATEALSIQLASALTGAGRWSEAAGLYADLAARGSASGEILNDLGNCYYKMEDYAAAETYYQQAMECSSVPGVVYRNLGLTRARLDKPKEAIWALEKYLQIEPSEHDFLHVVGDLYAKMGHFDSAMSYYEKYLQQKPNDPLALYNLSECYLHMGHTDSAIIGYRRVLQIDPHFKPAHDRLSHLSQPAGKA